MAGKTCDDCDGHAWNSDGDPRGTCGGNGEVG